MANNALALLAAVPDLPTASERETALLKLQELRDAGTVRSQTMADDATTRTIFRDNVDPQERLKALYAVNPKAGMALEKSMVDLAKERAAAGKDVATAGKTQTEALNLRTARYKDSLNTIQDRAGAAAWVQSMYADPDIGPHIVQELGPPEAAISRIPDPATDPAGFATWKRGSQLGAEKLAEISKPVIGSRDLGGTVETTATDAFTGIPTVTATRTKTQTPDSVANNARIAAEGAANRSNQLQVQDRITARQNSEGAADIAFTPAAIANAAGRYNVDGTLPPMGMGKSGSAGRAAILNAAALLKEGVSPTDQRIAQLAAKADAAAYGASARAYSAAGKEGQAIQATNTGLNHLATVKELALAQQNGDVRLFNELSNRLAKEMGQPAPTNLAAAISMVSPEVSKAVVGAAGGQEERAVMAKNFSGALSPAQAVQGIGVIEELMGGRLTESQRTYERTMGKRDFRDKMLSPAAQRVLDRARAKSGDVEPGAPGVNAQRKPSGAPAATNAQGWMLHTDAQGNRAYVSPDGKQFQEVK